MMMGSLVVKTFVLGSIPNMCEMYEPLGCGLRRGSLEYC